MLRAISSNFFWSWLLILTTTLGVWTSKLGWAGPTHMRSLFIEFVVLRVVSCVAKLGHSRRTQDAFPYGFVGSNPTPRTTFRVQRADFDFVSSSLAHLVRSAPSGILHTSIRRQPLDQFSLPNSKGFGSLPKLRLFLLYRRLARSCRFPYML